LGTPIYLATSLINCEILPVGKLNNYSILNQFVNGGII